jgi:hypothetical protein
MAAESGGRLAWRDRGKALRGPNARANGVFCWFPTLESLVLKKIGSLEDRFCGEPTKIGQGRVLRRFYAPRPTAGRFGAVGEFRGEGLNVGEMELSGERLRN